jgi:hypothetical protein
VPMEWARLTALACARFAQGRVVESDALLGDLKAKLAQQSAYQIAEVHGFRRELDQAFEWLERSYRQRDSGTGLLKCDPLFRNLHADPRWLPFLRKMNLADDQLA